MSDWTCPPDRFPLMIGMPRVGDRRLTVPLEFVEAHEAQAQKNHGQTVVRLKERGGLSWCELFAVVTNQAWKRMDLDEAHERVMAQLAHWRGRNEA